MTIHKQKTVVYLILFLIWSYGISISKSTDSTLPTEIIHDTTLTETGSPYVAEGTVTIAANATLTVEAGVEIHFPTSGQLKVLGSLVMNGTQDKSIILKPRSDATRWSGILVHNATAELHYVHIDTVTRAFDADYGEISLFNCVIRNATSGECVYIKHITSAVFANCEFYGIKNYSKIDAVDCDFNGNGRLEFTGNCFYDFSDEAIDIGNGSANALIKNNIISNCKSMGISIGENSSAVIEGNVISGCYGGIEVHHGAYAYINHNTLFGNGNGVICWHNSEPGTPNTGGTAEVVNTILSESKDKDYSLIASSNFSVSYSLSEKDSLPGEGNIFADPLFLDTLNFNLRLKPASPCINAGDPASPKDPDSSRTDIGAYPFLTDSNLVINEIHYNPSASQGPDSVFEFVELYNRSQASIDLSGYRFPSGIVFSFPDGSSINPGEYILITSDSSAYGHLQNKIFQWAGDSLDNSGELLLLEDKNGLIPDYVEFSNQPPWPAAADGQGASLELIDSKSNNSSEANWASALFEGGTPGRQNSVTTGLSAKKKLLPAIFKLFQNYPNPFNPKTVISYQLSTVSKVELSVYNVLGQKISTLVNEKQPPAEYRVTFNAADLASGIYFYRLLITYNSQSESKIKKMVFIQ